MFCILSRSELAIIIPIIYQHVRSDHLLHNLGSVDSLLDP